jgi:uncharacterized protein involved in exopolysaccharide biosynthesis
MHSSAPVRTPRDRLDRLLALFKRMLRFWWLGLIVTVLVTGGAIGAATVAKKAYMSETVLLYHQGIQASTVLGRDAEVEQTRKLGLRLRDLVLARPQLQKIIDKHKLYPALMAKNGPVEAVDEMRKSIVFKVREGDTFLLQYRAPDPELAQQITSELAATLMAEDERYRTTQAEVTRKFIAEEKARAAEDLRAKETELAGFLAKHPEFAQDQASAQGTGGAAVRAAQKDKNRPSGDSAQSTLEREAARLRQRLDMPATPRPVRPPERDPRLVAAKDEAERKLLAAQHDLQDKQSHLTDAHPDVIAAKQRVRDAEAGLRKAQQELASGELIMPAAPPASVEERPALQARLASVEGELSALKRRKAAAAGHAADTQSEVAAEIVGLETDWARISRDTAEARERYQQLESKEFVAQITASSEESGQASQMVVIDPAYRPEKPVGGGRLKVAIFGLIAGLIMAFGVALGCAIFDDRLYDKSDAEALDLAPLLVVVPRLHKRRARG